MKRVIFALMVCGMGAVSFGQLLPDFTKLFVLKGTCTDTVHYVLNDPVPDTAAALRAAYGVDALALAAKPKVYYFLVVEVKYTPQFVAGKWTGEGTITDLDFWTLGAVEYGIGRHDADGKWQAKLAYAYDIGGEGDTFVVPYQYWYWPKAKARTGDAWIISSNAAGTFVDDRSGIADVVFSAKLVTNKTTGKSWYEPSITSLTIAYTQLLDQKVGTPAGWRYTQMGAGKMVFKPDAAMTTKANLTDGTGANIGLAQVAADINAFLVKGKYPPVTPNLDPGDYIP